MAFTRYHDDESRIMKKLQQQTDQQRWYLDVPGTGDNPAFALDPHIIPQKWGGNLWTNKTDLQSSLMGLKKQSFHSRPMIYPTCDKLTTEQSRAIMPAWTAREMGQNRGHLLLYEPQEAAEIPFQTKVSTRIHEKDNFKQSIAKI